MRSSSLLSLLPLLLLAACGEDQPSTAPTLSDGTRPAQSLSAANRVVNSLADPGNGICSAAECTLREAIKDPGSSEISFAPGLSGTITLAPPAAGGGTLGIDKGLTITGPSAGIVILRRSTDPAFRIVRIGSGATVSLSNLTIQNGQADQGGGIINFGTLELSHITVTQNSTGGIDNHGPLTLTNSAVTRSSGLGLINHNGSTLTLSRSTVANNTGGGIANAGGVLTLTNCSVTGNSNTGISASRGTTTITNTRVAGNSTSFLGGGIFLGQGTLTLSRSTVAGNSAGSGGGIVNRDGGRFTIIESTVSGNTATGKGGGIFNNVQVRVGASLTLTNSTISGNSAGSGGGIYNSGFLGFASVSVTNSTIVRNRATQGGGGIRQEFDEAGLGLTNALVAENRAPTGPDALNDPESSVSARFSLIGDGTGSGISNTDGNQVGRVSPNTNLVDPRIGLLAFNGGPTRTHDLHGSSPAIDAGSDADCPATDQRGVPRPQGAGCDIGSYERE
jgi:CSLREA domain-containing protein